VTPQVGEDAAARHGGGGHAPGLGQGQLALLAPSGRYSSYANPLAGPRPGSPAAAGVGAGAGAGDAEAARCLVPPQPHVAVERALRRSAGPGAAGRANRQQLARWLRQELLDPNDPRCERAQAWGGWGGAACVPRRCGRPCGGLGQAPAPFWHLPLAESSPRLRLCLCLTRTPPSYRT
jgi:hypothetical protein